DRMRSAMGYNVRKNWVESFTLMVTRPIVILPFIIVAFLEGIALELVYFSPRRPISYLVNPLVKKFFGEGFVHYPGSLLLLPKLFYYAQVAIYLLVGALLAAITVAMVRNLRMGLPLKANALIKNALKRYTSFLTYALVLVALMFLVKKVEVYVFVRVFRKLAIHLPQIIVEMSPFMLALLLFLSSIILQVFLLLVIPIIVMEKKMILKAFWGSIVLGFRNFLSIFALISVPFMIYLPIVLLRTGSDKIIAKTFPEVNILIAAASTIVTVFVECFIMICGSHFLLDKEGTKVKK
ncbi:MAG: hypothetical protein JW869_05945, partial [Candidatus Omnitrophica bacterium]|nr:hypothetical protein [Candidatus Omnitrophota bacterium]